MSPAIDNQTSFLMVTGQRHEITIPVVDNTIVPSLRQTRVDIAGVTLWYSDLYLIAYRNRPDGPVYLIDPDYEIPGSEPFICRMHIDNLTVMELGYCQIVKDIQAFYANAPKLVTF